jgi:hypothetical protein
VAKKVWTPAARAAFARKMKAARLAKRGGRRYNVAKARKRLWAGRTPPRGRRKNPVKEWIVDAYASFHGAAMHPIVQVVTADTHGAAVAAYKNKLAREGYAVGKLISVREGSGLSRRKNPTKEQIKSAASRIAKAAGSLAWRGAKLTGRAGKASAKAAAAEVKASICRQRAPNPKHKRRRNPLRIVIRAVPKAQYRSKHITTRLNYDGRNFTANKAKRRYFSSVQPAEVVARQLIHRFPILRTGYVVTLNSA